MVGDFESIEGRLAEQASQQGLFAVNNDVMSAYPRINVINGVGIVGFSSSFYELETKQPVSASFDNDLLSFNESSFRRVKSKCLDTERSKPLFSQWCRPSLICWESPHSAFSHFPELELSVGQGSRIPVTQSKKLESVECCLILLPPFQESIHALADASNRFPIL